jgi:hypothetical protein
VIKECEAGVPIKKFDYSKSRPIPYTQKEWNQILDEIIEGFEVFDSVGDILEDEEARIVAEKKFKRAMYLFGKHFRSFWT